MSQISNAVNTSVSAATFPLATFPLRSAVFVHGLAVVSNDGFIARDKTDLPNTWASKEDFAFLQSQLSSGGVCVMGHATHKLFENVRGRQRVVFSRSETAPRLADSKTLFLNPELISLSRLTQLCANHATNKNDTTPRIFVLGGTLIYDFFLSNIGFDRFDLTRESNVRFGSGLPLFSDVSLEHLATTMTRSGMLCQDSVALNTSGLELLSFSRPKLSETQNARP